MSEWVQMTLGDFITLQRGHDLPEANRKAGKIPVVGSFGVTGYHNTAIVEGPGVTIGRSGASFGTVFFCPVDFWPHNAALYVTDFHGNDEKFTYYFLSNFDFTVYNSGSAQPSLNRNYIYPIPVLIPPLDEQRAIAHILGSLDDKIELNRRMNETLEATARAIFKSWFVDFDPVHAKASGEQPVGMDAETAALFPDTFDDSELGPIPSGWRVGSIGEEITAVGGGTPSTKNPEFWEGGTIHWTTPKDLSSLQSPILLDTDRRITSAGLKKISSGLLPVGTVLMSSRAPVGYLALAQIPVAINQGYIAMLCDKIISNYFVLLWCDANMHLIQGRATGTTFREISKRNFRTIPIIVPPKHIIRAFTRLVEELYHQISNNSKQSRTLAELRDTLLPKLVSGELRVGDVEF